MEELFYTIHSFASVAVLICLPSEGGLSLLSIVLPGFRFRRRRFCLIAGDRFAWNPIFAFHPTS
jgi:hypothetical protein